MRIKDDSVSRYNTELEKVKELRMRIKEVRIIREKED